MTVKPEQAGTLGAEMSNLDHERPVVIGRSRRIRADAAGSARCEQPFAHPPVGEARKVGVRGGEYEVDQVFAVELAFPSGLGRRRDLAVRESVELGHVVKDEGELVGIGQQVLFEAGGEGRQARVDVTQCLLVVIAQAGPGQRELGEIAVDEVQRLGVECEAGALLVHGFDARVEGGIEPDRVGVGGQQRREFFFEVVREVSGVGRAFVEEDLGDPGEHLSAALEGDERVVETGGIRCAGDSADFGELLDHALQKGRPIVVIGNGREGRQLVRQRAAREKRVVRGESHASTLTNTVLRSDGAKK